MTAVLKQTPASKKSLLSYRSKIRTLAHPVDRAVFKAARNARVGPEGQIIGVIDLVAIARGSKTFRDGVVMVVSKSAAGGSNETPATKKIRDCFDKAIKAAKHSDIPTKELELIFKERIALLNSSIPNAFNESAK